MEVLRGVLVGLEPRTPDVSSKSRSGNAFFGMCNVQARKYLSIPNPYPEAHI